MKTLLILLLISPLPSWSQSQIPATDWSLPKPYGDTLKPIEFREIPYTYTTSNTTRYNGRSHTSYSTHNGLQRLYSYDGIDVDNPEKELWRYLLAVNDPDVERQRIQFQDIVSRQETATTVGASFMIPGLIMLLIGGAEASAYKKALSQQQQNYHSTVATYTISTPPTKPTGPTLANCGSWTGYNGIWTCESGPYSGQSTTTDPFSPTPTPAPTPTPVSSPVSSYPTAVDQPNGVGIGVAGLVVMFVGAIVSVSAPGDRHSTFLKAVQYYNRALKQKFSWEMKPYANFNHSGLCLTGHF